MRSVVFAALLSLLLPCSAAGAEVNAAGGERSGLFLKAMDICCSYIVDEESLSVLETAGRTFGVASLNEYAALMRERGLDCEGRLLKGSLGKMYDIAVREFGARSVEAVKCGRAMMYACWYDDAERVLSFSERNEQTMRALHLAKPDDWKTQELWLLCRLERLAYMYYRYSESPFVFADVYRAERQIDSLYAVHPEDSETRVYIYLRLAQLKPIYTSHVSYLNWVKSSVQLSGVGKSSGIYYSYNDSNALEYYQAAAEMAVRLFGEDDVRTLTARLAFETFCCMNKIGDADEAYERVKDIRQRGCRVLNSEDNLIHDATLVMWEYCVSAGKRLDETAGYREFLAKVKKNCGSRSRQYVEALSTVVYQRLRVDVRQAVELLDELYHASEQVCDSDLPYQCLIYSTAYEVVAGTGDSKALSSYLNELRQKIDMAYADVSSSKAGNDWSLVVALRRIAYLFYSLYDKPASSVYYRKAIDLERKLSDGVSLVLVDDLMDCSTVLANGGMSKDALEICREAIDISKRYDLSPAPIYKNMLSAYAAENDTVSCRQMLQEAVRMTENKKEWNVYYRLMYASYLAEDKAMSKTYEELMQSAYPEYLSMVDQLSGVFLDGCFSCGKYLLKHNRVQEALDLLVRGFNRFIETDGQYNSVYSDFVMNIVYLYKDILNDYNSAERFLGGVVEEMVNNQSNVYPEVALQLLWTYYDLLNRKGANFAERMFVFQRLLNQYSVFTTMNLDEKSLRDFRVKRSLPLISALMYDIVPEYMNGKKEIENREKYSFISSDVWDAAMNRLAEIEKVLLDFESYFFTLEEDFRNVYPDCLNNPDYNTLLSLLSTYCLNVKEDTLQAEKWLMKGLGSTSGSVLYNTHLSLSTFYRQTCQYRKALEQCEILERMSAESHNLPMDTDSKRWYAEHKSFCYYSLGEYGKAAEMALEVYRLGKEVLEENFDLFTEDERENYLNSKGGLGNGGICMLLAYCSELLAPHAYDATLLQKGYLLRASERTKRAIQDSGNAALKAATDSLALLKEQYKGMAFSHLDMTTLNTAFNDDVWNLQRQKAKLEKEINDEIRKLGIPSEKTVCWQDVRGCLGERDVAIEYVFGDSIVGALVLKKSLPKPLYVRLGDCTRLWQWIEKNSGMTPEQRALAIYQQDELNLYALLWQPLESSLSGAGRIFFSPSGFLNSFSLGAIRCPDGKYMMDKYSMVQLTTTAALVNAPKKKKPVRTSALFGGAYYSEEQMYEEEIISSGNKSADGKTGADRGAIDDSFSYLPYTKHEVESLSRMFSAEGMTCQCLSGKDCTESELRKLDGNSPDILHFATHGFFVESEADIMQNVFLSQFPNRRNYGMMRAGLAFSGANETWQEGNADKENDGILTAEEVSAMNLEGTRLVVLSACETGVGIYTNEGVYGMYRGFKQAGVGCILASLWKVDDYATSVFVDAFYDNWLQGKTMQQAYHVAVNKVRGQFPNPYFWAPFILIDGME